MITAGPKSRRAFMKAAWAGLGVFSLWLMNIMTRRDDDLPENATKTLTVPMATGESVRFFDSAIVVQEQNAVAVYSSHCTHLGCRINRVEGNQLVCPCHGSRFNLEGDVLHGPALHGLQPLAVEVDRGASLLHITLSK